MGVAEDIIAARIYGTVRCGLSSQPLPTIPEVAKDGIWRSKKCNISTAHVDPSKMNEANDDRTSQVAGKMAKILLKTVKDAVPKKAWKSAHFHNRGRFSKLRIEMVDGSMNRGVNTPTSSTFFDLLDELRKMREELPKKWYAFTLTVTPDKNIDLQFDYNEEDPTFFLS